GRKSRRVSWLHDKSRIEPAVRRWDCENDQDSEENPPLRTRSRAHEPCARNSLPFRMPPCGLRTATKLFLRCPSSGGLVRSRSSLKCRRRGYLESLSDPVASASPCR